MTRLQIRNLIRRRLGETTAAFWEDTELNTWIDKGCRDLAFRAKCLRDNNKMTIVSGTGEYSLSDSFPGLLSILDVYFYINGTTWDKLEPISRADLDIRYPGWKSADSSVPFAYYWDREENVLGFYYKPDSSNDGANYAEVYYTKDHTDLADDDSTPGIPEPLHLAICDFVVAFGLEQRGWGDKSNDAWQKYFTKLHDYQVERQREREDDEIIMKNYRNI